MKLSKLKQIQNNAGYSLCAGKDHFLYVSHERGIAPIMTQLAKDPYYFQDCMIVDAVIGKAAAMMLVRSHAASIYGKVMSKMAKDYLDEHKMSYTLDTLCPYVVNRTMDGMCPMEQTVLDIDDPEEAYRQLNKKIRELNRL